MLLLEEFKVFTSRKQKNSQQDKLGERLILETQIVLVESIILHCSKLYFIQLFQTEMNRRTAIISLQCKNNLCPLKKNLNNLWELVNIGFRDPAKF